MLIGTRGIGPGSHPVCIIAEIGVNHDGSPERALSLIDAAHAAGADAVKFQYFEASRLMSRASALAAYQASAGERDPIDMLRRLELSFEALCACISRAHELDIHAIVTPFSVELVRQAESMRDAQGRGWDAYKTASPDVIHQPLLLALAATGKPLIVSTGAAEPHEIGRALGWLAHAGTSDPSSAHAAPVLQRTALLQCVSSYPTPLNGAELGAIRALIELRSSEPAPGPIGYSDHTPEIATGAIAVAAGARLLEKHLTHDRAAQGPDHAASLDPAQFTEYVRLARAADAATANSSKRLTDREREVRHLSRQSLIARRAIRAGERIDPADIAIKRPGTGLPPWMFAEVVGREALRNLDADTPITAQDVRVVSSPDVRPAVPLRLAPLTVAVVTGARAEFGLLKPVIAALRNRPEVNLRVIAAGSHLLGEEPTLAEVGDFCHVAATVAMQSHPAASDLGDSRARDAAAVAAGIEGFRAAFASAFAPEARADTTPSSLTPGWVVVLGDRIEAFAAASAAAVMGLPLAHIHGGDRAEGIADESLRHAISKLAHLHLPATTQSARRLERMGEEAWRILSVGSPAVDGLTDIEPLTDAEAVKLGDPALVVLLHPTGHEPSHEAAFARSLFDALDAESARRFPGRGVFGLMPNHDAGRDGIADELRRKARDGWLIAEHLPRPIFLALLKRLASNDPARTGLLVGNSSAGLIEAAALGVRVLNVGPRQSGRERAGNVIDLAESELAALNPRLTALQAIPAERLGNHPYGDGRTGKRIADALLGVGPDAQLDPRLDPANTALVRKRNSY